jgi:hypothetical protein
MSRTEDFIAATCDGLLTYSAFSLHLLRYGSVKYSYPFVTVKYVYKRLATLVGVRLE